MSNTFFGGNHNITKMVVSPVGEITALDIDGKKVDLEADVALENNKAASINVSTYSAPVEITPTSGKTAMKKATVTLTDIPDLEANKEATISVATYDDPVEITPTSGKDGMEKVTVTLSNIPSGGSATAYCWQSEGVNYYFDFDIAPENGTALENTKQLWFNDSTSRMEVISNTGGGEGFNRVSDTEFVGFGGYTTFIRQSVNDITIW